MSEQGCCQLAQIHQINEEQDIQQSYLAMLLPYVSQRQAKGKLNADQDSRAQRSSVITFGFKLKSILYNYAVFYLRPKP